MHLRYGSKFENEGKHSHHMCFNPQLVKFSLIASSRLGGVIRNKKNIFLYMELVKAIY